MYIHSNQYIDRADINKYDRKRMNHRTQQYINTLILFVYDDLGGNIFIITIVYLINNKINNIKSFSKLTN